MKQLKWLVSLLAMMGWVGVALATTPAITLNNISFQVSAQRWVKTETAQVVVAVDATLEQNNVAKARADIIKQLYGLESKAEWHITTFQRSQDQSGLERLHLQAVARLSSSQLVGLRQHIKAVSKAGRQFRLVAMHFTPSDQELAEARSLLREQIYKKVQQELKQINTVYPNQRYFVHQINFTQAQPMPVVALVKLPTAYSKRSLSVGPKMQMSATVILSSKVS